MGRIYEYDIITTNGQGSFSKIFRLPKEWKYVNAIALLKYTSDPAHSPKANITLQQNKKIILNAVPEYFLWLEEGFKSLPFWLPFQGVANDENIELYFDIDGFAFQNDERWRVWFYCSNEKTPNDFYFNHLSIAINQLQDFNRYKIELPTDYNLFALGLYPSTDYNADISIINDARVYLRDINPFILTYSPKVEFFKRLFAYELKSNKFDVEIKLSEINQGNIANYEILIVSEKNQLTSDSIRTK